MQEELYFDGDESMLPDLDADDVDRSLRFVAPHTGFGVDVLRPGDFGFCQRLQSRSMRAFSCSVRILARGLGKCFLLWLAYYQNL